MKYNKSIEKIIFALDLGFSDIYADENVREFTLEDKLCEMQKVVKISNISIAINFSIFNNNPKDPISEIYSIDFPSDLKAAIYEVLGGYYRQAIMILRSWMELRLTGIYYSFINRSREEYENWSNGNLEGPHGRRLIGRLFSRHEFRNLDADLRTRLEKLYGELCAFVHGGGIKQFDLYRQNDNVPRYNPDSFDLWYNFLNRVFFELCICYYIAYGQDAFTNLSEEEIEAFAEILDENYKTILKTEGVI